MTWAVDARRQVDAVAAWASEASACCYCCLSYAPPLLPKLQAAAGLLAKPLRTRLAGWGSSCCAASWRAAWTA